MTKRQIIKNLKNNYPTLKKEDSSHDLVVLLNDLKYYIKILNLSANTILSFNSKTVWEIKKGKISGIRFLQYSSTLLKMAEFIKKENKILLLTNKPYKILKQINESEIVDVSEEQFVHDIFITQDLFSLKKSIVTIKK